MFSSLTWLLHEELPNTSTGGRDTTPPPSRRHPNRMWATDRRSKHLMERQQSRKGRICPRSVDFASFTIPSKVSRLDLHVCGLRDCLRSRRCLKRLCFPHLALGCRKGEGSRPTVFRSDVVFYYPTRFISSSHVIMYRVLASNLSKIIPHV